VREAIHGGWVRGSRGTVGAVVRLSTGERHAGGGPGAVERAVPGR
jgi:hypothetical protein